MAGTLAAAAPPVPAQEARPNSLVQGAWAVEFGISNNFTLQTFSGSLISIEGQFWSSSSIRLGLGLSLAQDDYSDEFGSPDTLIARNGDRTARGVSLQAQYVRYAAPEGRTSLYWGIGPSFSYSKSEDNGSFSQDGVTLDDSYKSWSVGALASLGVVWFPTRTLGVHAEYGLRGSYESRDYERTISGDIPSQGKGDANGWRVGGAGVLFGLSAYF